MCIRDRVRKVFAEHLQQSTNFELLWSDKVGFVWLAIGLNPVSYTHLVDHRSYKRRGIDKIPSVHLGPAASQMAVSYTHLDVYKRQVLTGGHHEKKKNQRLCCPVRPRR